MKTMFVKLSLNNGAKQRNLATSNIRHSVLDTGALP